MFLDTSILHSQHIDDYILLSWIFFFKLPIQLKSFGKRQMFAIEEQQNRPN